MPKTGMDAYFESRKKTAEVNQIDVGRNLRDVVDSFSPNHANASVSGSKIGSLQKINENIYNIYANIPELNGDADMIEARYAVDTIIATAFGTDIQDVVRNNKKYRKLVFGDSNIDDKTFFNAVSDSAKKLSYQKDIAKLNKQYLNTDPSNTKARAQIDAEINEAKKAIIRLGNYQDRGFILNNTIEAMPVLRQVGESMLWTAIGIGAGGLIGGIVNGVKGSSMLSSALNIYRAGKASSSFIKGGQIAGMIADGLLNTYTMESGLTIDSLRQMRDENDKPLDEDIIKTASILSGIANTVIEYVTPDIFGNSVVHVNTVSDFINNAAIKTLKEFGIDSLKKYGAGVLNESSEEMFQQMVSTFSENLALSYSDRKRNTNFNVHWDDATLNIIKEGIKSFGESLFPMLLTGGLVSTAKFGIRMATSKKAVDFINTNFSEDTNSSDIEINSLPAAPNRKVDLDPIKDYIVDVTVEETKKAGSATGSAETSTSDSIENVTETKEENTVQTDRNPQQESEQITASSIREKTVDTSFIDSAADTIENIETLTEEDISSAQPGEAISVDEPIVELPSINETEQSVTQRILSELGTEDNTSKSVSIPKGERDETKPTFTQDGREYQLNGKLPAIRMVENTVDSIAFADAESANIARLLEVMEAPGARIKVVNKTSQNAFNPAEYGEISEIDEKNKTITVKSGAEALSLYSRLVDDGVVLEQEKRIVQSDGSLSFTTTRNNTNENWKINISSNVTDTSETSSETGYKPKADIKFTKEKRNKASEYIQKSFTENSAKNISSSISKEALKPSAEALILYSRATGISLDDIIEKQQIRFVILTDKNYQEISSKKGRFEGSTVKKNGIITINLTKDANPSTIIHEIGHAVRLSLTPEQLKAFSQYYGSEYGTWTEDVIRKQINGKIVWTLGDKVFHTKREAMEEAIKNEERFANDFVSYVISGEAPTAGLKTIFERVRKFLTSLLDSFSNEISSELKERFDALFTTDYTSPVSESQQTRRVELFKKIDKSDSDTPSMQLEFNFDSEDNQTETERANASSKADPSLHTYRMDNAGMQLNFEQTEALFNSGYFIAEPTFLHLLNDKNISQETIKEIKHMMNVNAYISRYDMIENAKKFNTMNEWISFAKSDLKKKGFDADINIIRRAYNYAHTPSPAEFKTQFLDKYANRDGVLTLASRMLYYKTAYKSPSGKTVIATRKINNAHISNMLEGIDRKSPDYAIERVIADMQINTKLWLKAFNTVFKSQNIVDSEGNIRPRTNQALYMDYLASFNSDWYWDTGSIKSSSNTNELFDWSVQNNLIEEAATLIHKERNSHVAIPDLTEEEYTIAESTDQQTMVRQMQKDADNLIKLAQDEGKKELADLQKEYRKMESALTKANESTLAQLEAEQKSFERRIQEYIKESDEKQSQELEKIKDSYNERYKKRISAEIERRNKRMEEIIAEEKKKNSKKLDELKSQKNKKIEKAVQDGRTERDQAVARERLKKEELIDKIRNEYENAILEIGIRNQFRIEGLKDHYNARISSVRAHYKEKELKTRVETMFKNSFSKISLDTMDASFVPIFQTIALIRGASVTAPEIIDRENGRIQENVDYDFSILSADGATITLSDGTNLLSGEYWENFVNFVRNNYIYAGITAEEAAALLNKIQSKKLVKLEHRAYQTLTSDITGETIKFPQITEESNYLTWDGYTRYILLKLLRQAMNNARSMYRDKTNTLRTETNNIKAEMASALTSEYYRARQLAYQAVLQKKYAEYVEKNKALKEAGLLDTIEEFAEWGVDEESVDKELIGNTSEYFSKIGKNDKANGILNTLNLVNVSIMKPQNLSSILDSLANPEEGMTTNGEFFKFFVRKPWENRQVELKEYHRRISEFETAFERILGYSIDNRMSKNNFGRTVLLHYGSGQDKTGKVIPNKTAEDALMIYIQTKNGEKSDAMANLTSINGNNIAKEDIEAIINGDILTEKERELGDWMIQELANNYDRIAKVAYETENKLLLKLKNYFPMHQGFEETVRLAGEENSKEVLLRKLDNGFTNMRSGKIYPINTKVFSLFFDTIRTQEHYAANNAWAIQARMLLNDSNSNGVGSIITSYKNKQYRNALREYYNRIVSGDQKLEEYETMLNQAISSINSARIMASIPSHLRQFISLITAKSIKGNELKNLFKYTVQSFINYGQTKEFVNSRDEIMKTRTFETTLQRYMNSPEFNSINRGYDKFVKMMFYFMQHIDTAVANAVWLSAYNTAIENKQSEQDAIFTASNAVATTQSTTDVLSLSKLQSDKNPFIKSLLAFTNDLFQMWGHLWHVMPREFRAAYLNLREKNPKKAAEHLLKASGRLIAPVLAAGLSALIGASWLGSDDDDDLFDEEDYRSSMWQEIVSQALPILGPDVSSAMQGFWSDRSFVGDVIYAALSLNPVDKTFSEWSGDFGNALITASQILGIPANLIKRVIKTVYDTDDMEFDLNFGSLYNSNMADFMDRN